MSTTEKNNRATEFGSYDTRGHWKPPYPVNFSPLFEWPLKPKAIFKWLFGYPGFIWPVHILYVLLAFVTVVYFQPAIENCKNLEFGWIGLMLLRNFILIMIVFVGLHLVLYTFRLHGDERKYNPSFQEETKRQFLFGKQPLDNAFRTLVFGLPIWTAYEVLYVWAAANGRVPYMTFQEHPFWFVAWFFLIPFFLESHFYFIHRLLHWGPLFKYVHSVHHLNPNPGPLSGLAMHPVEHLLYFSATLIYFIIPSNPVHFFYHIQILALGAALGHTGFEGPLFNGKLVAGDYFHYLHHKYVTCNFGTNTIPWDKWLGVYFNGEGEYRPGKKTAAPDTKGN